MSIPYPLSLQEYFARLPICAFRMHLRAQFEADLTGSGERLWSALAPNLWDGEITLAKMDAVEASHAEIMLDLLTRPGAVFWVYDPRRPAPLSDPTGSGLSGAVPVVDVVGSSGLAIAGLPAGYVLSLGDYVSWSYDGGRRALHRIATSRTVAGPDGRTPLIDLSSIVRAGTAPGTAVSLIRPPLVASVVIGSVQRGQARASVVDSLTFSFQQTLARVP